MILRLEPQSVADNWKLRGLYFCCLIFVISVTDKVELSVLAEAAQSRQTLPVVTNLPHHSPALQTAEQKMGNIVWDFSRIRF